MRKQEFSPQGYGSGGKGPNLLCFTKDFLKKKLRKDIQKEILKD